MSVFDVIVDMIEDNSQVLDLGCEDCGLLERLQRERNIQGRGVEMNAQSIQECIRRGVSVFHGDLDEGLKDHPSQSYDYVVLSRTLQQVKEPHILLEEMLRVGRRVIVNFPNFAYVVNRLQLGFVGKMPVNRNLPYTWFDTPNIHFFTRQDFRSLCSERGVEILKEVYLRGGRIVRTSLPNLFASEVCCLLSTRPSAI